MVELICRAVLNLGVEQRVERIYNARRSVKSGFCVFAVSGERHDGVHRKDLLLLLCVAAGAQREKHREADSHGNDLFKKLIFHLS